MTLAGALVAIRALAVIPVAWALASDQRVWAATLFSLAAATDAIDGWVARRTRGTSRLGALLDPIADKTLVVGTALALAVAGLEGNAAVPPELVALLAVRELTAAGIRISRYRIAARPADFGGKAKTAGEMVALAVLIVARPPEPLGVAALWTLWIAVLFGFATLPSLQRAARRGAA